MKAVKLASLFLAGAVALTACSDEPTTPAAPNAAEHARAAAEASASDAYLVMFRGSSIPAGFADRVTALGGSVTMSDGRIGIAAVRGLSARAAERLGKFSGVQGIGPDVRIEMPRRPRVDGSRLTTTVAPESPNNPSAAVLFPLVQWNMDVIHAPAAWAAGYLGSPDVRVAILDSGIDPTHPDLVGRVDMVNSRSFVEEDQALINQFFPGAVSWTDLNGHGTNVAATVSSNGYLAAGVTSRTTLLAVKVLGETGGSWSDITNGIMYAADQDADVINMSLGAYFPRAKNGQFIAQYITRAVNYAWRKGSLVVVSAGNDAIDLDHDGNGYKAMCSAPTVMCVSAMGPTGPGILKWELEDLDDLAVYSNYGRSAINVAAPGGNYTLDKTGTFAESGGFVWAACPATRLGYDPEASTFYADPCSKIAGMGYSGLAGTSQATPHVSGLAALLVTRLGHDNPARIRAAIQKSTDDLGQPGTDPYYGKGRINVATAMGL